MISSIFHFFLCDSCGFILLCHVGGKPSKIIFFNLLIKDFIETDVNMSFKTYCCKCFSEKSFPSPSFENNFSNILLKVVIR